MAAVLSLHAGFLFKKSRRAVSTVQIRSLCDSCEKYLSASQNRAGNLIPPLLRIAVTHNWHLRRAMGV